MISVFPSIQDQLNTFIWNTCVEEQYYKNIEKIQMCIKYAAVILVLCSNHSTVNPYPS